MGSGIFGAPVGYVTGYKTAEKNPPAFISIVSKELSATLDCCAPLSGVTIAQQCDHSVTKSLDNDFLVATFGEQPVRITLSGLCVYGCGYVLSKGGDGLAELYRKLRVSTKSDNRVELGVYTKSGSMVSFTCIITGLDLEANRQTAESGACLYRMTLLGVEKR